MIPSRQRIGYLFKRNCKLKGVGEDCIGCEAYAVAPEIAAECYHPLYLKMSVKRNVAIQCKGGQTCWIPKPKLDPETEEGYRDVTLVNEPGKNCQKVLRSKLLPTVEKIAPPGVVGSGVRKGSTAHARVGLNVVIAIARGHGLCSGHKFDTTCAHMFTYPLY